MNKYKDFFKNIENYESDIVNELDDKILNNNEISLMSLEERKFVNGIIRKTKPKKILEVGVASGAGSMLLLNSIKDTDAKLYSIDYLENWWVDQTKKIGYLVEENTPNLLSKWKIYRGGVSAKFLEEIGEEIDICMLDTMHANPGEILDFITILPFLKKNGILIIHDIQLHAGKWKEQFDPTCCNLLSAVRGYTFMPESAYKVNNCFLNIGAVVLDDNIKEYIDNILLLLTMRWRHRVTPEDHMYISNIIKKYYPDDIYLKYKEIYNHLNITEHYLPDISTTLIRLNDNINQLNNKINILENNMNLSNNKFDKFINSIAWWIPIKKLRNNFRNKICRAELTI
ncbi:class I SAM-dependent methyltransferase [Brachyspira murdochii]|uniref:class I SAM-dependent methyltransferase n=1 Tax=Brachyspira murdochii TaxID=84378 RepID=UPI003007312E